jgi:hypothetical protein
VLLQLLLPQAQMLVVVPVQPPQVVQTLLLL